MTASIQDKSTSAELRARARELMKKAEEHENRIYSKLGREIAKFAENDFKGVSVEEIRKVAAVFQKEL